MGKTDPQVTATMVTMIKEAILWPGLNGEKLQVSATMTAIPWLEKTKVVQLRLKGL